MNVRRVASLAIVFAVACDPVETFEAPAAPPNVPTFTVADAPPIATTPVRHEPPTLGLGDDERIVVDPRTRIPPRSSALVLTETAQLQVLMRSARLASMKPQLLRRMAEDYVELAAAAERDMRNAPNETLVNAQQAVAATARRGAIAYYAMLLANPWNVPYAQRDEVRFYLALEYARLGDVLHARQVANELLAQSPTSEWAARARFLLGLEANAAGDQTGAREAFMEVARSNTPEIARIAQLRVGDAHVTVPQPIARADAHVVAPVEIPKPRCSLDMECGGVSVCRDSVCVGP